MKYVTIFLLTVLLSFGVIAIGFSIYGIAKPVQSQSFTPMSFSDQVGTFSKRCSTELVTCAIDQDCQAICKEQQDGLDMACISISDPNDKTGMLPKKKVCALREAEMKCGKNLGGVLTWSGWSNPDRMEWNCICQFPSYASNQNCTQFNSGICSAYDTAKKQTTSGFNWDVSVGRPELGTCTCPAGTTRQTVLSNQMQRCVPNSIYGLYKDLQDSVGFMYMGCYTGMDDISFLTSNTTSIVSVNGLEDAKTKFLALSTTFPFFAIAGTQMIPFTTFANATVSTNPVCSTPCSDNEDLKCGGRSDNTTFWAVYKKN